ncbi:MAG: hydrogen peroxide-inducible genes activator, partial [Cryomorphaceae bacterium]
MINLCSSAFPERDNNEPFEFESGNFETLIRLSMQGFGMTLIPYLTALDLPEDLKKFLKPIEHPQPGREISMVYNKAQLKLGMIDLVAELIKSKVPQKLL